MAYIVTAIILTAISAVIFSLSRFYDKERLSFIFKVVSSTGFIVIALLSYNLNRSNTIYFILIICALTLGYTGDISLGLKNLVAGRKRFLVSLGIILFLLGHIVYTTAFINETGKYYWVFIINLPVAVFMMCLTRIVGFKLSKSYKILGFLYSYTIALMLTSAIMFSVSIGTGVLSSIIAAGAVCFFVSDCLLSATYFKHNIRGIKLICTIVHATYYSAQVLLALSLLHI